MQASTTYQSWRMLLASRANQSLRMILLLGPGLCSLLSRIGGQSALKRLLFESQTQLLAILKDQITNPESSSSRKVPQAERESRMAQLRNQLAGVVIEGHGEPSHTLLDLAAQMYEQNVIKYIPLEKCFSRLVELTSNPKTQSKQLEIESSKIVVRGEG